ncbi:MAG: hypothetical protein BGO31_13180 [Bacteroidetes bacterium 43-16]|nr:MAG: hypothetical protein BGO31_13180 [Bacteroidetes bacterium 43-16]
MSPKNYFTSDLDQKEYPVSQRIAASIINPKILLMIQEEYAGFDETKFLSLSELNDYRQKYIAENLRAEVGALSELEQKVLDTVSDSGIISKVTEEELAGSDNFAQRLADKVARFGGSWTFILSFMGFLVLWIAANAILLHNKGFDPYPFILLNLFLSCLAALQAPVIMMSQNRQEEKDRDRAKKDYIINLKSEVEIRGLHEKLDHLLIHQQQHLLEIQQMQIELLQDILNRVESRKQH